MGDNTNGNKTGAGQKTSGGMKQEARKAGIPDDQLKKAGLTTSIQKKVQPGDINMRKSWNGESFG